MKAKTIGLFAIILAAGAIIAYKQTRPLAATSAVISPSDQKASVLLVADLSEADDKCSCGDIIRAVRAAQKKGVATQEFNPDSKSDLLKRYRVLTAPTVLFLDATGKEVARYEGEDEKTVAAIRSHLSQLTGQSGT